MRFPLQLALLGISVLCCVQVSSTRRPNTFRSRNGRSFQITSRTDQPQAHSNCDLNVVPNKRIVCYYRVEENFRPYDLDACLCTHVIYSYVAVKENLSFIAGKKGDLKFLASLKQHNPALKVLVSLRPSEKSFSFEPNSTSGAAASARVRRNGQNSASALRTRFAKRIKEFLVRHQLDGVDMDWEFFRETDRQASRRDLLVSVARTLRSTFRQPASAGAPPANHLLITVTTSKFPRDLTDNYDFGNLNKYVDFVNLPAFSFDAQGKTIRHPARLHGLSDMENTDSLVDLVLALGLPHEQLNVGLPAHGVLYKLSNSSLTTPGSPAIPWNYNDAIISHSKICAVRDTANWTLIRENDLTAPYIFNKDKWIGFDDEISIKLKAKYIVLRQLGGIAFWSSNDDDPTGKCGYGSYPLLQAVRSVLIKPVVDVNYANRTLSPGFNSSSSSTSLVGGTSFVAVIEKYGNVERVSDEDYGDAPVPLPCSKPGYIKHPKDCSRFYRCVKFDDQDSKSVQKFQYGCAPGLVFDDEYEICNWPSWSPSCTGSGEILQVTKKKFVCPSYGYFQDPSDCAFFYYCSDFGKGALQAYEFKCPFDLAFDEDKLLCNWKWLVKGCSEATNPESVDLNNFPHYLDHANSEANNQDLDGDQDDDLLARSDDRADVEFVDSPAEHRNVEGGFSFSKSEDKSRKSFARSIKDAVSDAIENVGSKVKNILGYEEKAEPEKRQDFDPMLLEESVISNWFSQVNPFGGYGNTFAHQGQVGKTPIPLKNLLQPSRAPLKKGEQFISIPIIQVLPEHGTGKPRRPSNNKHRPEGRPERPERPEGRPDGRPFGLPSGARAPQERPKPTPGHRHPHPQQKHHERPSHAPARQTNRPRQPQQPTGRPGKNPDLIPVPILTVRDHHHEHTAKPAGIDFGPAIQRRPDGQSIGLHIPIRPVATTPHKTIAIVTVKPTRRLPAGHPHAEPEPEPSHHKHDHRQRQRPAPEPEPEPAHHRKPVHEPHHGPIEAQPSINYAHQREPPRFNRPTEQKRKPENVRPKDQRHPLTQSGLPIDLFSNYDIDVKSLDVHPIFSQGGNVDLSQLQFLPSLEHIAESLSTKRPNFGSQQQQQQHQVPHREQRPSQAPHRPQQQQPPVREPQPIPPPPQRQRQQPQQQQQQAQVLIAQQQILQPQFQQQQQFQQHHQRQPEHRQPEHHHQRQPEQHQQRQPEQHQQRQPEHHQQQHQAHSQQHFQQQQQQHVPQPPQQLNQQQVHQQPPQNGNRPQFNNQGFGQYQQQPSNIQSHYQTNQQQQQQRPQQLAPQSGLNYNNAQASTITKNGFKPISPAGAQYSQAAQVKPALHASGSHQFNSYSPSSYGQKLETAPASTTTRKSWPTTSTRRPSASSPSGLAKTTKSSLLIIPVPDDHPQANNLNDIIRISKDYPHLFPHGFDFSKVASVTRTKTAPTASGSGSSGASSPSASATYSDHLGQQKQKNETKSDYIMVVVNEELEHKGQDLQRIVSTTTARPIDIYQDGKDRTGAPVVIKLEIPEGKPEIVKNIVDKVKESLGKAATSPSADNPVYISVTASVPNTPSSPAPATGSGAEENHFESNNKNIPQSLYASIQQVIAQHLYQQQLQGSSSTQAQSTTASPTESTSGAPGTSTPPPTETPQVSTSTAQAILEQIPYNYYYHPNATDANAQVAGWPYGHQPAWFQHPAYAPYYPSPVYAQPPVGNQSNQQYYPYPAYPAYQPQWPANNNYTSGYPGWYEPQWPYVNSPPAAPANETTPAESNLSNHRLPSSFYITTTITTLIPSTDGPTTISPIFTDSARIKTSSKQRGSSTRVPSTTTPVPTTFTDAPVTQQSFDILRNNKNNADAPQIQVYIVQGPNGPQVQTKTVNNKEGQKQPNVQVYVIDENSKEKTPYNHYSNSQDNQRSKNASPDVLKAQNNNQYYQYAHSTYQTDESQLKYQTTQAPVESGPQTFRDIEYEDDDQASYGAGPAADSRSPYHQFLPANKVQSLQSLYNSQTYPGLRNFTEGSVPEQACTRPGLFQHPSDCNKFYECYFDRFVNKYTLHLFECPVKLAFDSRIVGCSGPSDPTVCVQY